MHKRLIYILFGVALMTSQVIIALLYPQYVKSYWLTVLGLLNHFGVSFVSLTYGVFKMKD